MGKYCSQRTKLVSVTVSYDGPWCSDHCTWLMRPSPKKPICCQYRQALDVEIKSGLCLRIDRCKQDFPKFGGDL